LKAKEVRVKLWEHSFLKMQYAFVLSNQTEVQVFYLFYNKTVDQRTSVAIRLETKRAAVSVILKKLTGDPFGYLEKCPVRTLKPSDWIRRRIEALKTEEVYGKPDLVSKNLRKSSLERNEQTSNGEEPT